MRGKLLPFLGIAIGFIIVISIIWHFIAPVYNHLLVGVADRLTLTQVVLGEDNNIYLTTLSRGVPFTAWIHSSYLHYGLILVIALIAATPGLKLSQRFSSILVALIVLFVIHIVTILIMAKLMQSTGGAVPLLYRNPAIIFLLPIGGSLFPLLVWAGLSFRYWLPRR